jgi:hypothetical protein
VGVKLQIIRWHTTSELVDKGKHFSGERGGEGGGGLRSRRNKSLCEINQFHICHFLTSGQVGAEMHSIYNIWWSVRQKWDNYVNCISCNISNHFTRHLQIKKITDCTMGEGLAPGMSGLCCQPTKQTRCFNKKKCICSNKLHMLAKWTVLYIILRISHNLCTCQDLTITIIMLEAHNLCMFLLPVNNLNLIKTTYFKKFSFVLGALFTPLHRTKTWISNPKKSQWTTLAIAGSTYRHHSKTIS